MSYLGVNPHAPNRLATGCPNKGLANASPFPCITKAGQRERWGKESPVLGFAKAMKAIVEGHNLPALLEELRAVCRLHNLQFTVSNGLGHTSGRPRRQIPVGKVYDAFREHGSVQAVARKIRDISWKSVGQAS